MHTTAATHPPSHDSSPASGGAAKGGAGDLALGEVPPGGYWPHHPVVLAADAHGDHSRALAACGDHTPGTLILLGDQCLEEPLTTAYASAFRRGWSVYYLLGNHDVLSEARYDYLVKDHPDGDLSTKVIEVNGLRIGGLSGVFRKWAWQPRSDPYAEPCFERRRDLVEYLPASHRWRGGLPLGCRDAIFPDDVEHLAGFDLDVLVTHEAASTSRWGAVALDVLADRTGAGLLVHGHHHRRYTSEVALPSGRMLTVRGIGKTGWWFLEPPTVAGIAAQDDHHRAEQGMSLKSPMFSPAP